METKETPVVNLPLSGIRVAAFTQYLLGPTVASYLADMGADVVTIEPVTGTWERHWSGGGTLSDEGSIFHCMTHRNMRSLAVDLKSDGGRQVAHRLIEDADVLVENFRPGVMDRLGLGYDQLRESSPGLIYASCSGWGEDGPYKLEPGQDLLLQCFSGLASISGQAGGPPVPVGAPVVDQHGATLLCLGVLAALVQRSRTKHGQRVSITMLQAALDLQQEPLTYYVNGAHLQRSLYGISAPDHEAPYGVYPTQEGFLALSMVSIPELRKALELESLSAWEDDSYANREEISRELYAFFLSKSAEEWEGRLRERGIWCTRVLDYGEMLQHEATQHINPVLSYDHPDLGTVNHLRFPVQFESDIDITRRRPPRAGEHTVDILTELGFPPAEISDLLKAGSIYGEAT